MLIPLKNEELQKVGIYFSANTLYKWHSSGTHPELFAKIGGRVFLNVEEWRKIEQKAILESKKKATKIENIRKNYFAR